MNASELPILAILDAMTADFVLIEEGNPGTLDGIRTGLEDLSRTFEVLRSLDETPEVGEICHRLAECRGITHELTQQEGGQFLETRAGMNAAFTALSSAINRFVDAASHPAASIRDTAGAHDLSELQPSTPVTIDGFDDETFMDFFTESREHCDNMEGMLLRLEKNPGDPDAVGECFRAVHSIKGMAGFLRLSSLNALSHAMESLLDLFRMGVRPDDSAIGLLIHGLDMIRKIISLVALSVRDKTPFEVNLEELAALLERIATETDRLKAGGRSTAAGRRAETSSAAEEPRRTMASPAPEYLAATATGGRDSAKADRLVDSVKVKIERIDTLVNMVGELVITNNQVRQGVLESATDARLVKNIGQMNRIVNDLQELALSMRMLPISPTFQRLSRLVRDLSIQIGKKVEVRLSGEATELDRNVIEELQDPLVHIVRNAIDHGIGTPQERAAAGKPAVGTIRLDAFHQSGMVVIEIIDDGQGLDREAILRRAIDQGLVKPEQVLSDHEIDSFIFSAGFSTAEEVTEISGRGVGMDVVKRNIERLRGKIEVETEKGRGTTIRLRIPLTLAIIDGMVVRVGRDRFIIPTTSIVESLRPKAEQLNAVVNCGEVLSVRGQILPLLRLYQILGLVPRTEDAAESIAVVLQGAETQFAIQVDELLGQQQVVIKALGRFFQRARGVAGGSIMGDGTVGLILDVEELGRMPKKGCNIVQGALASGSELEQIKKEEGECLSN